MSDRNQGGWARSAVLGASFLVVAAHAAEPSNPSPSRKESVAEKDVALAKSCFEKEYPRDRWIKAEPIESETVPAAYPGLRFYQVSYGAPDKGIPDFGPQKMVLAVDSEGKIRQVDQAKGFQSGLKPVKTEEEARIAASAIIMLWRNACNDWNPPPVVAPRDVQAVEREGGGWECRYEGRWSFRIAFDQDGKLVDAAGSCKPANETDRTGPICFGGLFRERSGRVSCVSLEQGSVGEAAGMRPGDGIIALGGMPVPDDGLIEWLRSRVVPLKLQGGTSAEVEVERGGERFTLTVRWPAR